MFRAYKKYWKGYVDFTGRSSRSDYWLAVLANTIVTIILFSILIVVIVFDSPDSPDSPYHIILNILYLLVMTYFPASFIPSISLQVRRLRDAGFHWALIFLRFAFVIGDIVLLVLFCQPTKIEFPFN